MKTIEAPVKLNRRQLFETTAAGFASLVVRKSAKAQACAAREGTVRDRLWLFTAPANTDFPYVGRRSLMTPAEGAYYLSIPNILVIQSSGSEAQYGRFVPPFDQYAIALLPLKRVAWSIVGGGGYTVSEERRQVLELARRTPNFVGVMMDDFFTGKKEGQLAALTLDELKEIRQQLKTPEKELALFVTLYTTQLDLPIGEYLNLIDVVTLWTWKPENLANLDSNFRKLEKLVPHASKMLGCYFVDYDRKKSTSVSDMKLQCEQGLRWLREGRIEGIVFLGNTVEDLGFEAVGWTRDWIKRIGDTKL